MAKSTRWVGCKFVSVQHQHCGEQCSAGHTACHECFSKIKDCFMCRQKLPAVPIRALALEQIREHVDLECKFTCGFKCVGTVAWVRHMDNECKLNVFKCSSRDCDVQLTEKQLLEHAKICQFRAIPCPKHCSEPIPLQQVKSHMESAHDTKFKETLCDTSYFMAFNVMPNQFERGGTWTNYFHTDKGDLAKFMAKWVPNYGLCMTLRNIGMTRPNFRIITDTPKHLMSFFSEMLPIDSSIPFFDETECLTIPVTMFENLFGRIIPGGTMMVRLLVGIAQKVPNPAPECAVVHNTLTKTMGIQQK